MVFEDPVKQLGIGRARRTQLIGAAFTRRPGGDAEGSSTRSIGNGRTGAMTDEARRAVSRVALPRARSGASSAAASTSTSPAPAVRLRLGGGGAAARGAARSVLLSGPPGLGKTTLAAIMANEMQANMVTTAGPSLERGADLMGILTNLAERDVLFIDEIHRLPRVVEELLYPAMEDFSVNFVMDKGLNARTIRIPLRPFTMVGATTRPGMLSSPLRERFGIFHHLDFYSGEEPRSSGAQPSWAPSSGGRGDRAARARTPRIANRLLRRARLRPGEGRRHRDREAAAAWTKRAGGRLDRSTGASSPRSSAVQRRSRGLDAIAATINDEAETRRSGRAPSRSRSATWVRSRNGRKATAAAYAHLGHALPASAGGQGQLPL
jgi:Holliday junction DNA helicase RuvB